MTAVDKVNKLCQKELQLYQCIQIVLIEGPTMSMWSFCLDNLDDEQSGFGVDRRLFSQQVKPWIEYPCHSGIIFQLGYNSGHIGNPFTSLFYPHRSEYPAFHLVWPKSKNQKILDPVCCVYLCYLCMYVFKYKLTDRCAHNYLWAEDNTFNCTKW